MPNYIIKDLTAADVYNDAVFALDRQFFPEHLLWSRHLWLNLIEESFVKKGLYVEADGTLRLIGNIVVPFAYDRRVNDGTSGCLQIWTLALDKQYHRQGLGTLLLAELAKAITVALANGHDLFAIKSVDLSTETDAAYNLFAKCGFNEYSYAGKHREKKRYMWQSPARFVYNMRQVLQPNLLTNQEEYHRELNMRPLVLPASVEHTLDRFPSLLVCFKHWVKNDAKSASTEEVKEIIACKSKLLPI